MSFILRVIGLTEAIGRYGCLDFIKTGIGIVRRFSVRAAVKCGPANSLHTINIIYILEIRLCKGALAVVNTYGVKLPGKKNVVGSHTSHRTDSV